MNNQRVMMVLITLAVGFWWSACGGPKQLQTRPVQRETSDIRARSANAFAELEAAERGEPTTIRREPEQQSDKSTDLEMEKKPYMPKPVVSIEVNSSRTPPGWINSQPNMPGYYLGIGVSTSHGNQEDDWARARNHAYVELASTLKVRIQSVIMDYFKENNLRLYKKDNLTNDLSRQDSSYAMDTSFFVEQTLEGVEIHDRWKDTSQNKYWMLVRLSKAELDRRIRKRLEGAKRKALDYFRAALAARSEGRIAEAFQGCFRAYLALRDYFGGVVEYDVNGDGKTEVLNHEIERTVQRLASGLKWEVKAANHDALIGKGLDEPLSVKVSYNNQAVKGLPVAFDFQRGTGSVEKQVTTEGDGVAAARVLKVFGQEKAILGAQLDVYALVEGDREARVVKAKFGNQLGINTGKFFIDLQALSVFVRIQESSLGYEEQTGSIASDIKELLHKELGVVFKSSSHGADLEIVGKAQTGSCTDFYQKRMCTARVQVSVKDRLNNQQLFSKQYKVNGTGQDDTEASRDALRKAGPRIAKKIIQQMM